MRPESASRSRYTACTPRGSDCGYARAVYIERFDRPPRQCRSYGAPTAEGSKELAGPAPKGDAMPTIQALEKSCEGGNGEASFVLAARYDSGDGVEVNLKRRIKFERRACELGN